MATTAIFAAIAASNAAAAASNAARVAEQHREIVRRGCERLGDLAGQFSECLPPSGPEPLWQVLMEWVLLAGAVAVVAMIVALIVMIVRDL